MLAWYHGEGGHVFELFGGTPRLAAFAEAEPHDAWRRAAITAESMRRRGQLGHYWSTLAAGTP
jgi:hypothetical protein